MLGSRLPSSGPLVPGRAPGFQPPSKCLQSLSRACTTSLVPWFPATFLEKKALLDLLHSWLLCGWQGFPSSPQVCFNISCGPSRWPPSSSPPGWLEVAMKDSADCVIFLQGWPLMSFKTGQGLNAHPCPLNHLNFHHRVPYYLREFTAWQFKPVCSSSLFPPHLGQSWLVTQSFSRSFQPNILRFTNSQQPFSLTRLLPNQWERLRPELERECGKRVSKRTEQVRDGDRWEGGKKRERQE